MGALTDGRPRNGAAIGVVPVCSDAPDAPAGCAVLRELRGMPLLIRSLDVLLRSQLLGQVRVTVATDLVPVVEQLVDSASLPGPGRDAVRVTPVTGQGYGHRIRAAVAGSQVPAQWPVVVHDPLYALASADLVREVLDALLAHAGRLVAAVPVRPVTDTLKWVDENEVVLGTADRNRFQMVYSPQAYWSDGLLSVLGSASPEQLGDSAPETLPRLFQAAGGRLLALAMPVDMLRLTTSEDVALADATLHVAGWGSAVRASGSCSRRAGARREAGPASTSP